ncbi:MAG: SufD family Fe-S cluster assembly protein, partial [Candidatus Eremiobacteraeota bacterium]|nr:SufD family Fe-S cluster assembly protein [Candidatus Eremiobacteraeota bacterium]
MSGEAGVASRGFSKRSLEALLAHLGPGSIEANARYDALARFEELPVRVTIRGGRGWKHDLTKLDFSGMLPYESLGTELDLETLSPAARRKGAVIERFSLARERHRDVFEHAFGRAVDTRDDKFASLALAFQNHGAFIHVPAGVELDEPIVIGYEARAAALCPYTLVSLADGARATVVERLAATSGSAFVCGLAELVIADSARLTYVADQRTPIGTRLIMNRRAVLGADAHLDVALAELGGGYSMSRFRSLEGSRGGRTGVVALFFSDGDQHIDLETETIHAAGATSSETIVRSAGTGRGQGRYLGNIKILADAHGAEASLRDDALLLSAGAHIDSVPALEIAANDVKAFHGAT